MNKNVVKLNESTLRKIISESIKKVLNESSNAKMVAMAIISELKKLNFEERGHEIQYFSDEYQVEVAVTNMNVPANADCREIAERFGCEFYVDNSFNLGIFEIE